MKRITEIDKQNLMSYTVFAERRYRLTAALDLYAGIAPIICEKQQPRVSVTTQRIINTYVPNLGR
jgi:hypothetical protein